MRCPFVPHYVTLKSETFDSLVKRKIIGPKTKNQFPVIVMDINIGKGKCIDPELLEDEDDIEEDISNAIHDIEVAKVFIMIGIKNYGYFWLSSEDIVFKSILFGI